MVLLTFILISNFSYNLNFLKMIQAIISILVFELISLIIYQFVTIKMLKPETLFKQNMFKSTLVQPCSFIAAA